MNNSSRIFMGSVCSTVGFISVLIGILGENSNRLELRLALLIIIGICSIIQWICFYQQKKRDNN